ncbi:unnamed protein product [Caenorhabditis auriculariae]|uniref:Cytochrome b5 n=1 Tax=Caenorhabditis auriculariae TaxID=2777116 RepID=A0A8S1GSK8_9PELO|nr:unnamed protein product [Caenorhabditis auriculariae]
MKEPSIEEEPIGSYHMRKPGEVRIVYELFLILECPVHALHILCILLLLPVIFSASLIHRNLKVIILSYISACFGTSVCRTAWLICEYKQVEVVTMDVFMYIRTLLQNVVAAHLFVISAERLVATWQSQSYEHGSSFGFVLFASFLTYPLAVFLLYSKYNWSSGREINVTVMVLFGSVSIIATAYVYFRNVSMLEKHRWTNISRNYQMRENVRMSKVFLPVFITGIVLFGVSSIFLLRFSSAIRIGDEWTAIVNGFIFDVIVASTSLLLSGLLLFLTLDANRLFTSCGRKIRLNLAKRRASVRPNSSQRSISFRDFRGKTVQVGQSVRFGRTKRPKSTFRNCRWRGSDGRLLSRLSLSLFVKRTPSKFVHTSNYPTLSSATFNPTSCESKAEQGHLNSLVRAVEAAEQECEQQKRHVNRLESLSTSSEETQENVRPTSDTRIVVQSAILVIGSKQSARRESPRFTCVVDFRRRRGGGSVFRGPFTLIAEADRPNEPIRRRKRYRLGRGEVSSVHVGEKTSAVDEMDSKLHKMSAQVYSRCEVSMHCTEDDCWIIVANVVYDITPFLGRHPGGFEILLEFAGCDATQAFEDVGHSTKARMMLANFKVGELEGHERDDFELPEYVASHPAAVLLPPTN